MATTKYLDYAGLETLVSKIKAADEVNANAIAALEELVGDTAVATQISTAISNATGASSQLAQDVAANKTAVATLTGADTVAGSVAKAEKDAKAYTDAEILKLDATVGSTSVDTANGKHVAVQVVEANGVLTGVTVTENDIASKDAVDKLAAVVGATELAAGAKSLSERLTTVEGIAGNTSVATQIQNVTGTPKNGTLQDEIEAVEADVDALQALHVANKTVAQEASDAITGIASVSKDNGTSDLVKVTVTTKSGSVSSVAVDDSALDTAIADAKKAGTDAQAGVGALEALVGSTSVASQISSAIADATGANSQLSKDVAANKTAIQTLTADDKTAGSVANTVALEVAKIINDNDPSDIDTLSEIAAWIVSDTTGAAKMANDISGLQTAVTALQTAGGQPNVIETIKKNGTALTVTNKAVDVTFTGAEIKATGYTVATTAAAIAATDTINQALGKLEKTLGNKVDSTDIASIPTEDITNLFK